jgi:hypothetical protein
VDDKLLNFRIISYIVWEVRREQEVWFRAFAVEFPRESSDNTCQTRSNDLITRGLIQGVDLSLSAIIMVYLDMEHCCYLHIKMNVIPWHRMQFKLLEDIRLSRVFKFD